MVALVQSMDCKVSSFNLFYSHAIPHLEPYLSNRHIFVSVLVPSLLITAIDVACGSEMLVVQGGAWRQCQSPEMQSGKAAGC